MKTVSPSETTYLHPVDPDIPPLKAFLTFKNCSGSCLLSKIFVKRNQANQVKSGENTTYKGQILSS